MAPEPNRSDWRVGLLIGAAALGLYARTLDRDFAGGDVAEVQMSAECLGITHPPGYALQSLVGYVFTYLPFGSMPTRVNALSAVSAAACVALLFGVMRRLGIGRPAAAAALATLATSDLFWRHARYAEVYTFHTMLVALGLFCAVRFTATRAAPWWAAECVVLGAACSARPSLVLLLPAIAAYHGFSRMPIARRGAADAKPTPSPGDRPSVDGGRLLSGAALFALPFALTFAYFVWRDTPQTSFNYLQQHVEMARLMPGMPAASLPDNDTIVHRAQRAAWTMSVGQFRGCIRPTGFDVWAGIRYYLRRIATQDLSAAAFLLIPLGLLRWRRSPGAALLAVGLWAGDFAIYATYESLDRITFTLPGLAALTLLLGAGIDGVIGATPRRAAPVVATLLFAPAAYLLMNNYAANDASSPERLYRIAVTAADPIALLEPVVSRQAAIEVLESRPPAKARIYAPFITGRALQCALHMGYPRPDLDIVVADEEPLWIRYAQAHPDGRPSFALPERGLIPWPPSEATQPANRPDGAPGG